MLKASDGTPVFLRDVAEVEIGAVTRQGAVTRDGKGETVAGMAIMLRGENSKTVVERVKEAVQRIQGGLPKGARIDVFYDRTELIEACIKTVMDALLMGAVLVILVLFLFLAELRTALIVVLSLPITFLFTFLLMRPMGISANLMSLGGLAFSVGMVVDASIVIVENIRRHLAERGATEKRRAIVLSALAEVARPVAFSVLIIALVLVPLFTLQGVEGKMFRPLAHDAAARAAHVARGGDDDHPAALGVGPADQSGAGVRVRPALPPRLPPLPRAGDAARRS